jgi:hypothetical protein
MRIWWYTLGAIGQSSLKMVSNPNEIILHQALECNACGVDLSKVPVSNISRHQVIDVKFKKHIVEKCIVELPRVS